MQQRITSLWSGLLSFGNREDAAEHRIQQAPAEAEERLGTNIVAEYEKMKWSRVVSMESFGEEATRVWDLGPDIAAEFLLLNDIDGKNLARIAPLFDPEEFRAANPAPTIEQFKLPEKELE